MVETILGIGGNVGDPVANVREAVRRLKSLGEMRAVSDLYLSKPWGVLDQPDFVNAAAVLDVDIPAAELLQRLKAIELEMGRLTRQRWGPRIIDLDILFYGEQTISQPDLTIPHPGWSERAFVLVPLAQIREEFRPFLLKLPSPDRQQVTLLTQL